MQASKCGAFAPQSELPNPNLGFSRPWKRSTQADPKKEAANLGQGLAGVWLKLETGAFLLDSRPCKFYGSFPPEDQHHPRLLGGLCAAPKKSSCHLDG